eukprot:759825-Hanusia_phi.AAC.9
MKVMLHLCWEYDQCWCGSRKKFITMGWVLSEVLRVGWEGFPRSDFRTRGTGMKLLVVGGSLKARIEPGWSQGPCSDGGGWVVNSSLKDMGGVGQLDWGVG